MHIPTMSLLTMALLVMALLTTALLTIKVLKYESRHDSALGRFLLRRALRCPHHVGHVFFWSLKAEMHVPEVSERCVVSTVLRSTR